MSPCQRASVRSCANGIMLAAAGAPLELKKRQSMIPLLYVLSWLWLLQFMFTGNSPATWSLPRVVLQRCFAIFMQLCLQSAR